MISKQTNMTNPINIISKSYADVYDSKYIMKMILNFSIEKSSDLFKVLNTIKEFALNDKDKMYQLNDAMPFSVLTHNNQIVGFIVEKEFEHSQVDITVLCLDYIYIAPQFRNKGFCNAFLIEYSKLPRMIIADLTINKKLIKLVDHNKPIDEWYYYPNFDTSNIFSFINKDKTFNWGSYGLNQKYKKN